MYILQLSSSSCNKASPKVSHAPNLCRSSSRALLSKIFYSHILKTSPKLFVSSPSVTKRHIKTFKMHLARYLISRCYNFTHNSVFLSVLVFKSHDFSYQYQEQATPTPNIGFSKVPFFSCLRPVTVKP